MDDTRVEKLSPTNRKLDHPQNDNNRLIKFTDENVIKKFFSFDHRKSFCCVFMWSGDGNINEVPFPFSAF
jgi:hypothetical protein